MRKLAVHLLELLHKPRHMDTVENIKKEPEWLETPHDETVQQCSCVEEIINIKQEVTATALPRLEEESLSSASEDVKEEPNREESDSGEPVSKEIRPLCSFAEVLPTKSDLGYIRENLPSSEASRGHACSICGKEYAKPRRGEGSGHHQCAICGKSYNQKYNLHRHEQSHAADQKYCCNSCGETFSLKAHLNHHLKHHHDYEGRTHHCNLCGKSFIDHSPLMRHQMIHTDVRPHSCSICGKSFKIKAYLKSHLIVHSKDKSFSCKLCGTTFKRRSNCRKHVLGHSEDRVFNCSKCDKTFILRSSSDSQVSAHSDQNTYLCMLCS